MCVLFQECADKVLGQRTYYRVRHPSSNIAMHLCDDKRRVYMTEKEERLG